MQKERIVWIIISLILLGGVAFLIIQYQDKNKIIDDLRTNIKELKKEINTQSICTKDLKTNVNTTKTQSIITIKYDKTGKVLEKLQSNKSFIANEESYNLSKNSLKNQKNYTFNDIEKSITNTNEIVETINNIKENESWYYPIVKHLESTGYTCESK